MKMYQLTRFGLVAGLGAFLIFTPALAQQRVVDASHQSSPPPRGRGPFPGSNKAGHSAGLRLEVEVRDGRLRQDRSVLMDFILTNIGSSPISLPSAVDSNVAYHATAILTLWVTSDGIEPYYWTSGERINIVPTSADLYTESNNPDTLVTLAPNESMRVHASSPTRFRAGAQTITGHAELRKMIVGLLPSGQTEGHSELLGTADSEPVEKLLLLWDDPRPSR